MSDPTTMTRAEILRAWSKAERERDQARAELERFQHFASECAEVLSEYGNGTTDEDVHQLRDLAFSMAPDWEALNVPTRSDLRRSGAPDRFDVLAAQLRAFIRDVGGPLATREAARVLREAHASGAEAMRRRAVEELQARSAYQELVDAVAGIEVEARDV